MTYNEVIKAIDKVINRKYPEGVVPSAICTIEFFKGIRNIIDGYRKEAAYFEDRIDVINSEKNDTICKLRGEIERLKSYKNLYEDLKAENLETIKAIKGCKAEAIKEFAKKFEKNIKDVNFTLGQTWEIQTALEKTSKEMTEERK